MHKKLQKRYWMLYTYYMIVIFLECIQGTDTKFYRKRRWNYLRFSKKLVTTNWNGSTTRVSFLNVNASQPYHLNLCPWLSIVLNSSLECSCLEIIVEPLFRNYAFVADSKPRFWSIKIYQLLLSVFLLRLRFEVQADILNFWVYIFFLCLAKTRTNF